MAGAGASRNQLRVLSATCRSLVFAAHMVIRNQNKNMSSCHNVTPCHWSILCNSFSGDFPFFPVNWNLPCKRCLDIVFCKADLIRTLQRFPLSYRGWGVLTTNGASAAAGKRRYFQEEEGFKSADLSILEWDKGYCVPWSQCTVERDSSLAGV